MTPTIATIAVCAAAEMLPAPLAIPIINRIADRFEVLADRRDAAVEAARLAMEKRDAAQFEQIQETWVRPNMVFEVKTGLKRRRPIPFSDNGRQERINAEAAAFAAEEARLAAQYSEQVQVNTENSCENSQVALRAGDGLSSHCAARCSESENFIVYERSMFEEIARNDPHMRRA